MRQLKIAGGVLLLAAAVALANGRGGGVATVLPVGTGATLILALVFAALGAGLVADGAIALRLGGHPHGNGALRLLRRSLPTLIGALVLVTALPLGVGPLDLLSVAGFPIGYYMAAQGLLILFAILALRFARRLDAVSDDVRAGAAGDRNV